MSREPKESHESARRERCDCSGQCTHCRCRDAAKDTTKTQLAQVPALTGMVWLPALGALVQ